MAGGVTHNIGQLIVAMIVVSNTSLMVYAPALLVAGGSGGDSHRCFDKGSCGTTSFGSVMFVCFSFLDCDFYFVKWILKCVCFFWDYGFTL